MVKLGSFCTLYVIQGKEYTGTGVRVYTFFCISPYDKFSNAVSLPIGRRAVSRSPMDFSQSGNM